MNAGLQDDGARRRSFRVAVQVTGNFGVRQGHTLDVGQSTAFIALPPDFEEGEGVDVDVMLSQDQVTGVRLKARVARVVESRDAADDSVGIAVRWLEGMSRDSRMSLAHFLTHVLGVESPDIRENGEEPYRFRFSFPISGEAVVASQAAEKPASTATGALRGALGRPIRARPDVTARRAVVGAPSPAEPPAPSPPPASAPPASPPAAGAPTPPTSPPGAAGDREGSGTRDFVPPSPAETFRRRAQRTRDEHPVERPPTQEGRPLAPPSTQDFVYYPADGGRWRSVQGDEDESADLEMPARNMLSARLGHRGEHPVERGPSRRPPPPDMVSRGKALSGSSPGPDHEPPGEEGDVPRGGTGDRAPITTRPSTGDRPPSPTRPGTGDRPPIATRPGTGDRPPIATRPGTADRPPIATRPGTGDRPPIATRPGTGDRPPIATRPGTGDRPPIATRPRTEDRSPFGGRPATADPRPSTPSRPATADRPPLVGRPPTPDRDPATATPDRIGRIGRIGRADRFAGPPDPTPVAAGPAAPPQSPGMRERIERSLSATALLPNPPRSAADDDDLEGAGDAGDDWGEPLFIASGSYDGEERRGRPRVTAAVPVTYFIGAAQHIGRAHNVSRSGIYVETDQAMPVEGSRINIRLPVAHAGKYHVVMLTTFVVRFKEDHEKPGTHPGFGARFKVVDELGVPGIFSHFLKSQLSKAG